MANKSGKTEHSGPKKGEGAYYGHKEDAKKESNRVRRNLSKAQINDIFDQFEDHSGAYEEYP